MITYTIQKAYDEDTTYVEGRCVSTDAKPTTKIANGSLLMEMDTATMYLFDGEHNMWRAWE